jgi:hypothetical protein
VTVEILKPVLYKCKRCGADTEWDFALGNEPLCVDCWDKASEIYFNKMVAAGQRAYREANKDKVAAGQRAYREANKDKVAAWQRAYREANKDKVAAWQRK